MGVEIWILIIAIAVAGVFWWFKRDINKAKKVAEEAKEAAEAIFRAFHADSPGGKKLTIEEIEEIGKEIFDVVEAFRNNDN